jgi:CDP-diacylglycerol--glycerol-3-phosphate 3-phosphatidyltransferase
MERPERVVLIIIGALFERWGAMAPVLWILAVISTVTVVHRILYTYQQTRHLAPVREAHVQPLPLREPQPATRSELPTPNAPRL